jgi:ankyrin repeat protein
VTELINLHANVNHKTSDDWTPLQLAAFKNHLSVIEVLIGKPELDVNYSSHKKTAL